jgi:hypothetical protein
MNTSFRKEVPLGLALETSNGKPILISNVPSSFPTPVRLSTSKSSQFVSSTTLNRPHSLQSASSIAKTSFSTLSHHDSKGIPPNSLPVRISSKSRLTSGVEQSQDFGKPMDHRFPYSTENSFCLRSSTSGTLENAQQQTGSRVKVINQVGRFPGTSSNINSLKQSDSLDSQYRPHRKLEVKSK